MGRPGGKIHVCLLHGSTKLNRLQHMHQSSLLAPQLPRWKN